MPKVTLTPINVAKVIRSTPATFDAVMRGDVDAMLAVGNHFATIIKEMLRQPGTGRTYDKEIRIIRGKPRILRTKLHPEGVPRVPHTASAPGQPPASDTANLRNAIAVDITVNSKRITKVGVGVTGNAPYWELLEDGTRFMEPRPYIRPAYEIGRAGAGDKLIKKLRQRAKKILAKRRKG